MRRARVAPTQGRATGWRKAVYSLLVFATVVLFVDALVGDKGLTETARARRQHTDLSESIERLRRENAALREQMRRLKEDPDAIESLAREELGLIRPGEVLFIIKDAKPATNH
ncbi:MAG: septum formation initiator family protein [Acidobacteria bacterium]|nr:septum formation initiator family protein [Acidobacteriota bacterium]